MSTPILTTKLYVPPPLPHAVLRPRLTGRLNEGLPRKLTLISAPAGFGKTTLLGEWGAGCERPAAWLSLDEAVSDPTRFLAYLVAALQTIAPNIAEGVLGMLQSPQPPPTEAVLTTLLNETATIEDDLALVLDDYHVIDARAVDDALAFVLEDRKSTRLNSSHANISYAVFCLKKKKNTYTTYQTFLPFLPSLFYLLPSS